MYVDSGRPVRANTGHSSRTCRTGQFDPPLPFHTCRVNGIAHKSGRSSLQATRLMAWGSPIEFQRTPFENSAVACAPTRAEEAPVRSMGWDRRSGRVEARRDPTLADRGDADI